MRVPGVVDRTSMDGFASSTERALSGIQRGFFNEHTAEGKHIFPSGTWTPHDVSGAGLAFTSAGQWYRLGQMIVVTFRVVYPTTASGATALIGGLPFAAALETTQQPVWASNLAFTTDTTNALTALANYNATTITITNLSGTAATNAQLSTDTIQGVLIYRTEEP